MHVLPGFADEKVDAVAYRRQQDEEDDDDDGDHVVLFHRGRSGRDCPARGESGYVGGGGNGPGGGWSLAAEPGGSLGCQARSLELECAGRCLRQRWDEWLCFLVWGCYSQLGVAEMGPCLAEINCDGEEDSRLAAQRAVVARRGWMLELCAESLLAAVDFQ